MASEGRPPLLKKSRWLPLEREENLLKTEQRFQLRDLLRYTRFGLCPIAGCALSQIRRIPSERCLRRTVRRRWRCGYVRLAGRPYPVHCPAGSVEILLRRTGPRHRGSGWTRASVWRPRSEPYRRLDAVGGRIPPCGLRGCPRTGRCRAEEDQLAAEEDQLAAADAAPRRLASATSFSRLEHDVARKRSGGCHDLDSSSSCAGWNCCGVEWRPNSVAHSRSLFATWASTIGLGVKAKTTEPFWSIWTRTLLPTGWNIMIIRCADTALVVGRNYAGKSSVEAF
jgi:hypothetical protein